MKLQIIISLLIAASAVAQDAPDPVVTAETRNHKGKTFKVEKSERELCWRYVHDGSRLLVVPFLSNGETTTRGKLVTIREWEKCKKKLKLDDPKFTITPEQMEQIYRIDDEQKAGNEKDNE